MRYGLVFMDLDETLMDFKRAEREALAGAFAAHGLAADGRAILAYEEINQAVWAALERGEMDQESLKAERFRRLFERLGLDLDPGRFSREYLELLGRGAYPLPGAEEICAWIAERCPLAIVTNGLKDVQRARLAASPIGAAAAVVAISEEVGFSKPDPRIFAYACDRLGFHDRSRMIMVGDSLASDIRGGSDFGIDTCWFNPAGKANGTGLSPTREIRSLDGLRAVLEG